MGCMGCMGWEHWPAWPWPDFCCCQLDKTHTEMAIPLECAVSRDTGTSDYVNYQMGTSIDNKHPNLINGHITMMVLGMRWRARPGTPECVWRAPRTAESTTAAECTPKSMESCGKPKWHASEHGHHDAIQPGETRASRLGHWREDSTRP